MEKSFKVDSRILPPFTGMEFYHFAPRGSFRDEPQDKSIIEDIRQIGLIAESKLEYLWNEPPDKYPGQLFAERIERVVVDSILTRINLKDRHPITLEKLDDE